MKKIVMTWQIVFIKHHCEGWVYHTFIIVKYLVFVSEILLYIIETHHFAPQVEPRGIDKGKSLRWESCVGRIMKCTPPHWTVKDTLQQLILNNSVCWRGRCRPNFPALSIISFFPVSITVSQCSLFLCLHELLFVGLGVMVLNTTFNIISVISWRSVLLVEETGVPGENHRPITDKLQHIMLHRA
jgi:hypothetical protein